MFPECVRRLVLHALLQTIRDCSSKALSDRDLYAWTDSSRFEFWTAYLGLDADVAECVLFDIQEGDQDVRSQLVSISAVIGAEARNAQV